MSTEKWTVLRRHDGTNQGSKHVGVVRLHTSSWCHEVVLMRGTPEVADKDEATAERFYVGAHGIATIIKTFTDKYGTKELLDALNEVDRCPS